MTSRISGEALRAAQLYNQQNVRQNQRKGSEEIRAAGLPADKVELSPQALELGAALRVYREADHSQQAEDRRAKVEALSRQVQNGTYALPSAQQLAEKLLPALKTLNGDG